MSDPVEKRLTDRGIQPTAMRQLVLDYLLRQSHALCLADLEKGMARTDRTTLYRTLKTFESKGIIHGIDDGSGAVKYAVCEDSCDPVRHRDLHLHFWCKICGKTNCLPAIQIADPDLPDGYVLQELNLTAKGHCPQCLQQ